LIIKSKSKSLSSSRYPTQRPSRAFKYHLKYINNHRFKEL